MSNWTWEKDLVGLDREPEEIRVRRRALTKAEDFVRSGGTLHDTTGDEPVVEIEWSRVFGCAVYILRDGTERLAGNAPAHVRDSAERFALRMMTKDWTA